MNKQKLQRKSNHNHIKSIDINKLFRYYIFIVIFSIFVFYH